MFGKTGDTILIKKCCENPDEQGRPSLPTHRLGPARRLPYCSLFTMVTSLLANWHDLLRGKH